MSKLGHSDTASMLQIDIKRAMETGNDDLVRSNLLKIVAEVGGRTRIAISGHKKHGIVLSHADALFISEAVEALVKP